MRIVCMVARLLLGLMFVVFGLNGFLHFIPMKGLPPGVAGQFLGALMASHYMPLISGLELIGGLILLSGRFVPLGLTLLGPIVVNILFFHALMAPEGLPIALVTVLLWLVSAWGVRHAFAGILSPHYVGRTERALVS